MSKASEYAEKRKAIRPQYNSDPEPVAWVDDDGDLSVGVNVEKSFIINKAYALDFAHWILETFQ